VPGASSIDAVGGGDRVGVRRGDSWYCEPYLLLSVTPGAAAQESHLPAIAATPTVRVIRAGGRAARINAEATA